MPTCPIEMPAETLIVPRDPVASSPSVTTRLRGLMSGVLFGEVLLDMGLTVWPSCPDAECDSLPSCAVRVRAARIRHLRRGIMIAGVVALVLGGSLAMSALAMSRPRARSDSAGTEG